MYVRIFCVCMLMCTVPCVSVYVRMLCKNAYLCGSVYVCVHERVRVCLCVGVHVRMCKCVDSRVSECEVRARDGGNEREASWGS